MDRPTVDASNVPWVVEWLWVPLWAAVFELFRRHFLLSERVSTLETMERAREARHDDLKDSIEAQNKAIKTHNDGVLTAVNTLQNQTRANGHRLGVIEGHLINRGKD